jgi:signal transduction histidine kinase
MPSKSSAVDPDGLAWPRWVGVGAAILATLLVFPTSLDAVKIIAAVVVAAVFWLDCVVFLPRWVIGIVGVVGATVIAQHGGDVVLFLVILTAGEVGVTGSLVDTVITVVVGLAAIGVRDATRTIPTDQFASWYIGTVVATVSMRALRGALSLNAQLRAAQAKIAAEAATDERRRLAREIHDVIAHSMTVTMLHITAARLALQDRPASVDDAIDALTEAETQGRRSLADIRQTVGLLTTDEAPLAPPAPGADELPELVDSYAAAGVHVDCEVTGDLHRLSPATGVGVYRLVQEGLANAAKHAPGSAVSVSVKVQRRKVGVVVTNGAPVGNSLPVGSGGGLGIPGMTERVKQLGGRLRAGPEGHGWELHADLPVGTDSEACS